MILQLISVGEAASFLATRNRKPTASPARIFPLQIRFRQNVRPESEIDNRKVIPLRLCTPELPAETLERFCERVLGDIAKVRSSRGTAHERYLRVFKIIDNQDRDLGRMFSNPRRFHAWEQLCMIKAAGLLTDREMLRFSADTQDSVCRFVAHLTKQ